jgi:hypothetical protein
VIFKIQEGCFLGWHECLWVDQSFLWQAAPVVESARHSGDVVVSGMSTAVLATTAAATDDQFGLLLEADVALCGTHCS